jgi:formamidopyrimidine-DNA glycosylase
MPEGVEIKLSSEVIRPLLVERVVYDAFPIPDGRYGGGNTPEGYQTFRDTLSGKNITITNVQVRGKFMYWTFSNGWHLFNTFGMTGQWSPTQGKHPCFSFIINGSEPHEEMHFNDHRHFGTIKFVLGEVALRKKLDELGWDPLQMNLQKNLPWLKQQLAKSGKPIGEVMMDQGIFAGVGNYIRAEALYLSKLSPWRQSNLLTDPEVELLCNSIVFVMEESYQHQGATIHTYKTAYGKDGKYSTLFKVYGQKKDPMGRKVIKQQTPDKRSIHWCPEVQV